MNSVTIASGVGIALAYLVGCCHNIPLCYYYALHFNNFKVGGSVHWQNASLLPPLLAMAAALILIFTKVAMVMVMVMVIVMMMVLVVVMMMISAK